MFALLLFLSWFWLDSGGAQLIDTTAQEKSMLSESLALYPQLLTGVRPEEATAGIALLYLKRDDKGLLGVHMNQTFELAPLTLDGHAWVTNDVVPVDEVESRRPSVVKSSDDLFYVSFVVSVLGDLGYFVDYLTVVEFHQTALRSSSVYWMTPQQPQLQIRAASGISAGLQGGTPWFLFVSATGTVAMVRKSAAGRTAVRRNIRDLEATEEVHSLALLPDRVGSGFFNVILSFGLSLNYWLYNESTEERVAASTVWSAQIGEMGTPISFVAAIDSLNNIAIFVTSSHMQSRLVTSSVTMGGMLRTWRTSAIGPSKLGDAALASALIPVHPIGSWGLLYRELNSVDGFDLYYGVIQTVFDGLEAGRAPLLEYVSLVDKGWRNSVMDDYGLALILHGGAVYAVYGKATQTDSSTLDPALWWARSLDDRGVTWNGGGPTDQPTMSPTVPTFSIVPTPLTKITKSPTAHLSTTVAGPSLQPTVPVITVPVLPTEQSVVAGPTGSSVLSQTGKTVGASAMPTRAPVTAAPSSLASLLMPILGGVMVMCAIAFAVLFYLWKCRTPAETTGIGAAVSMSPVSKHRRTATVGGSRHRSRAPSSARPTSSSRSRSGTRRSRAPTSHSSGISLPPVLDLARIKPSHLSSSSSSAALHAHGGSASSSRSPRSAGGTALARGPLSNYQSLSIQSPPPMTLASAMAASPYSTVPDPAPGRATLDQEYSVMPVGPGSAQYGELVDQRYGSLPVPASTGGGTGEYEPMPGAPIRFV